MFLSTFKSNIFIK